MKKTVTKLFVFALFAINFGSLYIGTKDYAFTALEGRTSNIAVAQIPETKPDSRVEALERVFEKNNSPLAPYAKDYVKCADKYGVDWRLLPAISGLESSFGQHMIQGSHNGYGWGGGHIYFSSWEEGIDHINKTLASRYYGRGAKDVWTIGPIYAESPTWAVRVDRFMSQIDNELLEVEFEKAPLTI